MAYLFVCWRAKLALLQRRRMKNVIAAYSLAGYVYSHSPPNQELTQKGIPLYIPFGMSLTEEPPGWYLAKLTYILEDGNAVIGYKRGSLEEAVNLLTVSFQAKGNWKWFFPISSTSGCGSLHPKIPKVKSTLCERLCQMTSLSQHEHHHASVLCTFSKKCSDIDLEIRPDKCVSMDA